MKKNGLEKLFTAMMAATMVFASSAMSFAGTSFTYPGAGETPTDPANNGLSTEVTYIAETASVASYTVTVPQAISIPGTKTPDDANPATGEVKINGISTKTITVAIANPAGTVTMTSSGGQTLNATATLDNAVILAATTGTTEAVESKANVSAAWASTAPKVDSWTGTINYSVTAAA